MNKRKERASILWLLSKACKKEIPDELREPYYKDDRDEFFLKPQIIQGLASCEFYSLALACIYEDNNYACLNHTGVIQLLMRKGVSLVESHVSALTETVLIQNAPIRMNAHMIIMEAIMALFIKDILIADQVIEVVSRFHPLSSDDLPLSIEEVALFWVNKCALRFKHQIDEELNRYESESINYVPCVIEATDLAELGNGCSLLALLSFYCPDYINWTEICLKEQLILEEAVANLELLQYFCAKYLPYDICFLEIEDFLQITNSMKINLLTFVADLMFLFEIKPASCVRRPGHDELDLLEQQQHQQLPLSDEETPSHTRPNHTSTQLRPSRSQILSASQMKARSLRHTSWIDVESDEMSTENDHRFFQQQKLAKYFQPHQHLRQDLHKPQHKLDPTPLNKHRSKRSVNVDSIDINDLTHDLNSMHIDGLQETNFYLSHDVNSNHLHNNGQPSDDGDAPSTSPISFAKLSKIKENNCTTEMPNMTLLSPGSKPAINVAYSQNSPSNPEADSFKSVPVETEIGGQIMKIRMKLEEKRRLIELGRKQQEDSWKTQRQGIGKEVFLKALKKEKLNCSGSNSLLYSSSKASLTNDNLTVDASEMKENFDHSRQESKDAQLEAMKKSIDLMGTSTTDLDGDYHLLDQQRKLMQREISYQSHNGSSQFFLHKEGEEGLLNDDQVLQSNNGQTPKNTSHLNKRFQEYLNQTQQQQLQKLDSHLSTMNKQQNYSDSNGDQAFLNENPNLSELVVNESNGSVPMVSSPPEEKISSNNNNEKGFFILFEDEKKPRPMPPTLRSRIKPKTEDQQSLQNSSGNSPDELSSQSNNLEATPAKSIGFVVGPDPDPMSELEKAKKKEFIVIQSLKRRAEQETQRIIKEDELSKKRELERKKQESAEKRKEESRLRREAIFEQYRLRKLHEESEKEGKSDSKLSLLLAKSGATMRNRPSAGLHRSRPKSIHVSTNVQNVQTMVDGASNLMSLENYRASKLVSDHLDAALISYPSAMSSYSAYGTLRPQSSLSTSSAALKKIAQTGNKHNLPSLPPFLISSKMPRGSGSSDGVSEIGSTYSEYTGPKLYVKPTQKSNRGIIINAINAVLGGTVNIQMKKKVLEEINSNDSKHFLILFRGAGMQFRAIYSYNPDIEEIVKLHGTGPKTVNNDMMDKFYKYNSGSKNFNEVHTKHLTVTIDAFTIHNILWSGKRIPPLKKDTF